MFKNDYLKTLFLDRPWSTYTDDYDICGNNPKFFGARYGDAIGCNWIALDEKGDTIDQCEGAACHADISSAAYAIRNPTAEFYTSLWFGREDCYKACLEWIDWIVSKKSPWYKAAKGSTIYYDDEERPVAICLTTFSDDKCPAPIFMNFLHCSRMIFEQPGMIKYWSYLKEKYGMTPERALVYALHFTMNEDGTLKAMFERGHTVLTRNKKISLSKLENRKPDCYEKECLNKTGFPSRITSMWDKYKRQQPTGYYATPINPKAKYPTFEHEKYLANKDADYAHCKFKSLIASTLLTPNEMLLCPDKVKTDYMDPIYGVTNG